MQLDSIRRLFGAGVAWVCLFWIGFAYAETWKPSVSLDEEERWNKLDFLDKYDVLKAAKGPGGDVWFVHSEGLLSYDGRGHKKYELSREDLKGVLDLYVSSSGQVCILTTEKFLVWEADEIIEFEGISNSIMRRRAIVEDDEGRIFVITMDGLRVYFDSKLNNVDSGGEVFSSIILDGKGNLWALGATTGDVGMYRIIFSNGTIHLESIRREGASFVNAQFSRLFLDSQSRVWVFDAVDFQKSFCFAEGGRVHPFQNLGDVGFADGALDVVEVRPNEFWFASNRSLVRFDGIEFETFSHLDYPIPTTFPYLVMVGPGKLLLGGMGDAPYVIDFATDRLATYKGLNFKCEDSSGRLWFITEDHRIVRKEGEEWKVFGPDDGLMDSPNRIVEGPGSSIWVSGSHQEVAAVAWSKGEGWRLTEFSEIGTTFSHLAVIRNSDDAMIFGGGTPVSQLKKGQKGGGVIYRMSGSEFAAYYIPPPTFVSRVSNIAERVGDGLWFGGGNLYKSSPNVMFAAERNDIIFHRWIDHMTVDSDNDLWVACQGLGIYQYDGSSFTLHDTQNGLNDKRLIYLVDDRYRDRLLALTESGFYGYDGRRWSRWGLQTDAPYKREGHSVFQSKDGAIWINHSSRSWYLESDDLASVDLAFKTVRFVPETEPPDTVASIAFQRYPEGSHVQVLFEGRDFWEETNREDLEYSWRSNGGPWEAFSRDAQLSLSRLETGEHSIEVRARDRAGNVDASPAHVYFEVYLPVWKEAWFISLVAATVCLILFLIYSMVRIRVKAAMAVDEFKLDFFTNISHELRNPLAVIVSPVEMLMEKEADTQKRSTLQVILRNARKMQSMVDQLLQFRKLEKSKWTFVSTGGEIIGFVRDTALNLEPLWKKKEQDLEFKGSPDSFLCSFDNTVVQQVVDNLVSNAVKYSETGTRIEVEACVQESDGHPMLLLSVRDEGKGVPLHEQENILKPFYRIKSDAGTTGCGVGLASVNQLVNQLGGKISIESPVAGSEKGSCFSVELPLDPYSEEISVEDDPPSDRIGSADTPTILIVEDNDDLRLVLAQALSKQYHVIEAVDGEAGLDQARANNPCLVVSDVMMPKMDGFALCEKLKSESETSHIPVILLTARSSNEHRIHGLKSGADAYIAKPLDFQHLKARIENLLESRRELKRRFAKLLMVEPTEVTVTPTDELILRKAIELVEEHMRDDSFDVERFCKLMGMSGTSLRIKLKAITGVSPSAFIQKMRLKRAANMLKSADMQVSDVASEVGIYDLSYFGKIFRKEFGVTPSNYKSRREQVLT